MCREGPLRVRVRGGRGIWYNRPLMTVRKPRGREIESAVELAGNLGLDYPEMEEDRLWIAEENGRIVGVVALKSHPDCLELCALGVDPMERKKGIGGGLVEALMKEAPGDVHLATVIPAYFEKQGFTRTETVPRAFVEKRKTSWCEGCPVDLCTVMVRAKA